MSLQSWELAVDNHGVDRTPADALTAMRAQLDHDDRVGDQFNQNERSRVGGAVAALLKGEAWGFWVDRPQSAGKPVVASDVRFSGLSQVDRHTGPMQNERNAIAVVMAAFNAAPFIDEALASLAAQTRLPDEVVIVDDASRDDTVARARAWCNRLPLRILESETNVGPGAARARAMHRVRSNLVTFLDADDLLLAHHLEQLEQQWQTHGGIVSPRALLWRSGQVLGDYHRSLGVAVPRRHQLARLLAGNYVFYGALFARCDYEGVGGLRPVRLFEDWDLWVRMRAAGVHISVTDNPSVLYRRHSTNITQDTEAVEKGVAFLVEEFRQHHPEWLLPGEWASVRRHRRAIQSGHQGLDRLRHGDVSGLVDLAKATTGRWATLEHVTRKLAYRSWRAANDKAPTRLN